MTSLNRAALNNCSIRSVCSSRLKEISFISGDTRESFYTDSLRTLLSSYMPTTIIISKDTNNPDFYLPIMEGRNQDEKNKVYVCQNYVCDLPIDNLDSLKKKINELSGAYLSK